MYQALIICHSIVRWLVLGALLYSILRAFIGYRTGKAFTKQDDVLRHWTATIAHIQLMIGITLYTQSPIIRYFWKNFKEAIGDRGTTFFGLVHLLLMLGAITLITIGSALAKRKQQDREQFRTMVVWFTAALFLIFIAIPWPFSPLAKRPFIR